MDHREISRRKVLQGGAALAGLAVLHSQLPAMASQRRANLDTFRWPAQVAQGFPTRPGEEILPWLDQPAENPVPDILGTPILWENVDSWITPNPEFFTVKHYNLPEIDQATWQLSIGGMVERPLTLSLADLMSREHRDVTFTLECSGNHGLPFLTGAIGNAVWTGTPLAPLLQETGILAEGSEVVFFGADTGPETVNGLELTEQFARGMSLAEAMDPRNILCWAMNGEPLPASHGAPLRLIAPGWYGIANVKWLQRIEILDRPWEGRFMAREYVTIREEARGGNRLARFTLVGHARLKSAPARVTQLDGQYRIVGAAWGAPIAEVEVQIDDGPWQSATIVGDDDNQHTWDFWTFDWDDPTSGEHTIRSRAIDVDGNVQPSMDDPLIANKLTFWESNGWVARRVNTGARTFPETGHTLSGAFLSFWQQHGGLATFGFPITEEFDEESLTDGQTYRVQYFERQRFELHPENAAPYNVLLGLLGAEALDGVAHQPVQPGDGATCDYHDVTGHNACGRFRDVWRQGGLMIYGYPITEEFEEDGLIVQYFERARFEHHPAHQEPYDVLLGLLGYEALAARYGDNLPADAS